MMNREMQMDRRALYNALRMHWLQNHSIAVEEWQVEDYRQVPVEILFEKLQQTGIALDRTSFTAHAESHESPEELSESIFSDVSIESPVHDLVYLILFELWRRLLPEKRCMSIFCDELDHQIYLYDTGKLDNLPSLQDTLAYLEQVLKESTEQGAKPQQVFASICSFCANDIESFLYDFIAEQIDLENYPYAADLLDSFYDYMQNKRWFDFLQARLLMRIDPEEANGLLQKIIRRSATNPDIEFNFEALSYLVKDGEKELFLTLARQTLPLLEVEEDLTDLLDLCADYYQCLDNEEKEQAITDILSQRAEYEPDRSFSSKDTVLASLKQILRK